jgi:signal transduction histidine kinase
VFYKETGVGEKIGSTGLDEFIAYSPIEVAGLNWAIMTTVSKLEALAFIYREKREAHLLTFVFFILILYLSYFFAIKTTAPIVDLNKKMIGITKKNWQSMDDYFVNSYAPAFDTGSRDEIHRLSNSFSSMIKKIYEVTISKDQADELRFKAQVSNEAKSKFLSNMSHEIRTPLHGIISFSKYGITDVKKNKMDKVLEDFELIYSSADRLMRLLNDVLDLSKFESGKMGLSFSESEPSHYIEQICQEFYALAESNGLKIIFNSNGQLDNEVIYSDIERLMQVVKNLLLNAIKYSSKNTKIYVSLEKKFSYGKSSLQVCVSNTGETIPTDELDTIFDDFNQSTTSDKGSGGTGLGLSISRQIILAHNGHIWCECENLNHESVVSFTFVIPWVKSDEKAA